MSAEDILEAIEEAPKVASVWKYSELTQMYTRTLQWHPIKGGAVKWLHVADVRKRVDGTWWGAYEFDGQKEEPIGPFKDRFEAAQAIDAYLESVGWKLCR